MGVNHEKEKLPGEEGCHKNKRVLNFKPEFAIGPGYLTDKLYKKGEVHEMNDTQKALVYRGPGKYGLEDVPIP
jgi:hypothetical protein